MGLCTSCFKETSSSSVQENNYLSQQQQITPNSSPQSISSPSAPLFEEPTNSFTSSQKFLFSQVPGLLDEVSRPTECLAPPNLPCTLRIATWNIQQLTLDKIKNPGVKEVICLTLLENHFSIVFLQEIACREALQMICKEINEPTLPNVQRARIEMINKTNNQCLWEFSISSQPLGRLQGHQEYGACLYNVFSHPSTLTIIQSRALESNNRMATNNSTTAVFCRSPFLVKFKAGNQLSIVFISVHLKACGLKNEHIERTIDELMYLDDLMVSFGETINKQPVILCGDFNLSPSNTAFDCLVQRGLSNVHSSPTNISESNPLGDRCYDNIWWNSMASGFQFTGFCGVIRDGLRHPLIPKRLDFGFNSFVSDHCPVWADFYCP